MPDIDVWIPSSFFTPIPIPCLIIIAAKYAKIKAIIVILCKTFCDFCAFSRPFNASGLTDKQRPYQIIWEPIHHDNHGTAKNTAGEHDDKNLRSQKPYNGQTAAAQFENRFYFLLPEPERQGKNQYNGHDRGQGDN